MKLKTYTCMYTRMIAACCAALRRAACAPRTHVQLAKDESVGAEERASLERDWEFLGRLTRRTRAHLYLRMFFHGGIYDFKQL